VIHSLTSLSEKDFQDTAHSTERSMNIIQQVTTTLSRFRSNVTFKHLEVRKKHQAIRRPYKHRLALYSAFHTAVSSNMTQSDNVPENCKDARATPEVADWMKACEVETGKLRSLGYWEVLPRSSLPQNASVMKSQWSFKYKTIDFGDLKSVSHRSRFVAKGYSPVQGLHYFKNYAPVASFITIRLLFALTSIPNFKVLQYDVSVAFIQSKLDSNHPPVYCECAERYED